MNLLPELKAAYRFSIKGAVAKITLIMSIVTCVRLVTDMLRLPLLGFFSNLLHVYQVIFHTSMDMILTWLPFTIPPYVKDIVILFFLIGFIYQKVVFIQVLVNYHNPWIISHNYRNSKILYFLRASADLLKTVVFWPAYLKKAFKQPFLVVSYGERGPSALHFTSSRHAEGESFAYLGDSRLMMLLRLVTIIAGAFIVIVFNYAFGN